MTDNVSAEAHRCRQAGDFDRYNRTVLAQVFKFANIQEFDHYFYEKHFPDIYPKSVGVIDGYTLQQHTERVVRQFEHHYAECDTLPIAPNFFRGLLYLHDIGKPEACEKAGKHHQHRYTKKILIDFFTQQRLPGVHIALALLTGDPLGKYLKLFQSPLVHGGHQRRYSRLQYPRHGRLCTYAGIEVLSGIAYLLQMRCIQLPNADEKSF